MTGNFNINGFSSDVGRRGGAKPYLFSVIVTLPPQIATKFSVNSVLPLRIEQASLPTRSLMTIDQRYHGPVRRIPYSVMYQPMNLTVLLSDTMIEREIFMAWQDLALSGGASASYRKSAGQGSMVAQFDASYYDSYVETVEIMHFPEMPSSQGKGEDTSLLGGASSTAQALGFDPSLITNPLGFNVGLNERSRSVNPTYRVTLSEAYPSNVHDVPLSWGADDAARLSVEMTYFYAMETHTETKALQSEFGFAKQLRQGMNMLNRFAPALSLFKKEGIMGGSRAALSQAGQSALGNYRAITNLI